MKIDSELLEHLLACAHLINNTPVTYRHKGVEAGLNNRVLVIKGSNEARDWFRNFNVHTKNNQHAGFLNGALNIRATIPSTKYDFIVGHSQGGGIAQLLSYHTDKPAATFGAPMAQTKDHTFYKSRVIRVVNCNDLVPKLKYKNYTHHAELVYLPFSGEPSNTISKLDQLKSTIHQLLQFKYPNHIKDHDINQYIAKLQRALKS